VKQIRKRLTYANIMSSVAVFLVLGGATAIAAGLAKNSVGTKQLKNNAVTAAKIKNEAVSNAKLKAGSVTETKIANGTITAAKLGENSVTNGKIGESAVTTGKIAGEAVTTGKIANDAVTGAKVNESTLSGVVQNVTYEGKSSPGDSTDEKTLTVDCGAGKRAIGGFYDSFDFGPDVKITVHTMRRTTINGEDGRGLQFFAEEITPTANTWQIGVSAACATL
jgi:cytoskeletal protein RodZ